jgi:hypothetical protein
MSVDFSKLPSQVFVPRLYGVGAWTNHLYFARDLIGALRPSRVVELGVDRGESFFCWCQALAEEGLTSECHGIDSWQGDDHVGGYDETTWLEVSRNALTYPAIARLHREDFFQALERFEDESIDLIHLDGLHTEEACRRDFLKWFPKLKPGGIFLFHDAGLRERGFGVWKIWEEQRGQGRSILMQDWPGLGILEKSPANSNSWFEVIFKPQHPQHEALWSHYREKAAALHQLIQDQWRTGEIAHTAVADQSTVQVFYPAGGNYEPEKTVQTRVGHQEWKQVRFRLPRLCPNDRLRIDFESAWTRVEIRKIQILDINSGELWNWKADSHPLEFCGDCHQLLSDNVIRLQITGPDPQIILPPLFFGTMPTEAFLNLELRFLPKESEVNT